MPARTQKLGKLHGFLAISSAATVAALIIWLVNLDVAFGQLFAVHLGLRRVLPRALFDPLALLAVDLSTVSTGVFVLLAYFPSRGAYRVLRARAGRPGASTTDLAQVYPARFPFFATMTGLGGTLIGMWFALEPAGLNVAQIGTGAGSDQSQHVMDRLLSGTATALLSSLWAMVVAYLAAHPIPIIFRYICGAVPRTELRESAQKLTETLSAMGAVAARQITTLAAFGEAVQKTCPSELAALLGGTRVAIERLAATTVVMNKHFAILVKSQEQITGLLQESTNAQMSSAEQQMTVLREIQEAVSCIPAIAATTTQLLEAEHVSAAVEARFRDALCHWADGCNGTGKAEAKRGC